MLLTSVSKREILRFSTMAACCTATGAFAQGIGQDIGRARVRRPQSMPDFRNLPKNRAWAPGRLTPAPAPTAVQKGISAYMADELRYKMATALASAPDTSFPAGSVGAGMQKLLRAQSAETQRQMRANARVLFDRPAAQQQPLFGRFAGQHAPIEPSPTQPMRQRVPTQPMRQRVQKENQSVLRRPQRARSAQTDEVLKQKFYEAIEENLPPELRSGSPQAGNLRRPVKIPKTSATIVIYDQGGLYANYLDVYEPERLEIKWQSTEPGATHARWTLRQASPMAPNAMRTATGTAGMMPGGKFTIDLGRYLPAAPSDTPVTYHLEIQPVKRATPTQWSPVGDPSFPVSITYQKSTYVQPPFEFEETGNYHQFELYVDRIKCISDTNESGPTDEILLDGFTVLASGKVDRHGLWTVGDFKSGTIGPEPSRRPVRRSSFEFFPMGFSQGNILGRQQWDDPRLPWPRTYSITLMMAEHDDGGFDEVVNEVVREILGKLHEYAEEYIAGAVATVAGGLAGAAAGGLPGLIIGAVIGAIASGLIDEIFEFLEDLFDNADDSLGEKSLLLDIPSTRVQDIHRLAGTVHNLANGKTEFVSETQKVRFEKEGGKYDVYLFWKATDRVFT